MITMTKPKLNFKRGDIILALFPHSNLNAAKPRPALIVQADNLDTGLSQVIVAMITSKMFRADHPSRVTIFLATDEGRKSGLLSDSVIMADNLATIFYSEIDRKIGRISMDRVDQALRHTLGLL